MSFGPFPPHGVAPGVGARPALARAESWAPRGARGGLRLHFPPTRPTGLLMAI